MYWCEHCGKLVDGEEVVEEQYHHEVRDSEAWEITVCEDCGGEVEESGTCERCGEECNPNEEYCEVCREDFKNALVKAIEHICGDYGFDDFKETLYGLLYVGDKIYQDL